MSVVSFRSPPLGRLAAPRRGALSQVGAVLALHRAAVRGRRARWTVAAGLAIVPLLAIGAVVVGISLPADGQQSARILMPTAWLGFAVILTFAAATGGNRLLLPRNEGVTFPISPSADALGSLVLAPLNVAWLVQTFGLLTLTSWALGTDGRLPAALLLTAVYIAAATVASQTAAWLIEWTKTWRVGEWLLRAAVVATVALPTWLLLRGEVIDRLDDAPTDNLVITTLNGWDRPADWWSAAGRLSLAALLAHVTSVVIAAALLHRPARGQVRIETKPYPARPDSPNEFAAALRIDSAGVWRSAPLRRGLVAITAIPALAAAAAQLDWYLVVILPGLVTSGAGLLFGVNALCLDGAGAVWRASLPGSLTTMLAARLTVVAQLCLAGGTAAVVIAALRAPSAPITAEATAVVAAVLVTTLQVVAHCATWSVRRPYAASLRDSRDQPAPPAAMAAYSARLALATTGTGLLLSVLARLELTTAVAAAAAAIGSLAARRLAAAVRLWDDPLVRARAISVVAGS